MPGFLLAHFPVQFAAMDRSWEITPELCGTNWLRMFLGCALAGMVALGVEYLVDMRRESLMALVVGLAALGFEFMQVRGRLRYQLRLETDCISSRYSSGTLEVIGKSDVSKLRNSRSCDPRGQGLVVCGIGGFIRHRTEIFIPAALPDFELLRQTLTMWLNEPKPQSSPISPKGIPYSCE